MQEQSCRENYLLATVVVSNLVTLLVWGIGVYLIWPYGAAFALACLLLIPAPGIRLIRGHCVDCS